MGIAVFTSYLTQQATSHLAEATTICAAQAAQPLQQAALQVCVGQQTMTLGMNDTFFLALIGCGVCAVAALFVGRDPALQAAAAAKEHADKRVESARMTVTP